MGLGRQNGLEFGLLHRDAEFALVVDLQLVIFALFIDGKTYAPVDELLHHRPSTLGHDIVNRFVHDALTSLAIGLDIQFRGFFRAWISYPPFLPRRLSVVDPSASLVWQPFRKSRRPRLSTHLRLRSNKASFLVSSFRIYCYGYIEQLLG